VLAICAVVVSFGIAVAAEAQQAGKKIPRIGYLVSDREPHFFGKPAA